MTQWAAVHVVAFSASRRGSREFYGTVSRSSMASEDDDTLPSGGPPTRRAQREPPREKREARTDGLVDLSVLAALPPGSRVGAYVIGQPLDAGGFSVIYRATHAEQGTPAAVKVLNPELSVLAFNRRLYDRCRELGGSSYPISAVRLDVDDWKAHYGEQWDRLRAAKRRYDGGDVLASGPDVLGRRRPR